MPKIIKSKVSKVSRGRGKVKVKVKVKVKAKAKAKAIKVKATKPRVVKLSWNISLPDRNKIHDIVVRLRQLSASLGSASLGFAYPGLETSMDLTACHANGMPLNFTKLLKSDIVDFTHDLLGIRRHLNRNTGKLEDCFVPRCAR